VQRREDPERQGHHDGQQQRREGQLERGRQPLEHELESRLLVTERLAEVAAHGGPEKRHVLDVQGPIQAERAAQVRQLVHRGVAREHGSGRIAAQPERHEHERDDADGHERGVENLADEVVKHLAFEVARL
jgi:hypothetical protein